MKKVGLIRVLTTDDREILNEHGNIMKEQYGLSVISRCIPDQPHGVYDNQSHQVAIPKIVKLAQAMVLHDGVSAVTISCAAEPALEECRRVLKVPVIGAGSTGAHLASTLSKKIGVIGITQEVPISIQRILGDRLICSSVPDNVTKTTDLFRPELQENFLKECEAIIEKGASTILFACTGFSTLHLKEFISKKLDLNIPVIDLVTAQASALKEILN